MPLNDKAFGAKLDKVRGPETHQVRGRFRQVVPEHAFSPEAVESIRRDLNEAAIQAIWEHPAYPAMARRLAELGVPDREDNGLIAHALRDALRLWSGLWCLYLCATPGGLTFSRFDTLHEVAGIGGRARTHGMIAYLRFIGYIEPDADGGVDGRERRYRPTPRMREAFRRYFIENLEIAAPIRPEAAAMLPLMNDDQAFETFMAAVGEGMMIAGALARMNHAPGLSDFSGRRSGMVMLWVLLLSAPETRSWPCPDPFPIKVADIARRAGVSRAHLQRLLRDCQASGMMALDEGNTLRFRTLLQREVDTYNAMVVICMAGCARNTLALLAQKGTVRAAG